jgi:phytoene dehydrogenase-like protein
VSDRRDVVVLGGGANGLTAAALLGRGGRRVLLLERRDRVGGLAASDEFHPGFRSAGLWADTSALRPAVISALALERHGLRPRAGRPDVLALDGDGGLLLAGEPARAAAEIARRSARDAERYAEFRAFVERIGPLVRSFIDEPPLDVVGLGTDLVWPILRRAFALRRLGRRTMNECLRLPPMCAADWLDEWFETDLLKAALALPAIAGGFVGPRSPGTNLNLLLAEAAAGPGVEGGGHRVVAALESAAREAGVEIRTGSPVVRIVVEEGAVRGVRLASGEEIAATTVAASCDPKQLFLELLPVDAVATRLAARMRGWRTRGTTAWILLALDCPPRFAGRAEPVERLRLTGGLLGLERAFDAVKYRRESPQPALEIQLPTVADPTLAPPGCAVVSILVHFVPYDRDPGWDDLAREALAERVVSALEPHAPGLRSTILGRAVLDPARLAERYGLSGGQIHHGEHALDQLLVRPAPECVGYRTPIRGLWLCGAGSHPGGGLTCAPGFHAARAILGG